MRLSYSALLGLPSARFRLKGGSPPVIQTESSAQRFHCVLALPALAALRYYDGSDSCGPSPRAAGLPAYLATPSQHSAPSHVACPGIALHAITSVPDVFRTSPWKSRLVATHRRIGFVILRTASSPPVAPHPASQRRSYFQLQGLGLPWHGLSPCWCRAFTGALIPAKAGIHAALDPRSRRG